MPAPSQRIVAVGLAGVAIAAVATAIWLTLFRRPSYVLEASEVRGLLVGDPVEAAGVRVGSVSQVEFTGGRVRIRFQLDDRKRRLGSATLVRIEKPLLAARAKVALVEPCDGQLTAGQLPPGSVVQEAGLLAVLSARYRCRFGDAFEWMRGAAERLRHSEAVAKMKVWVREANEYLNSDAARADARALASELRRVAGQLMDDLKRAGEGARADSVAEVLRGLESR